MPILDSEDKIRVLKAVVIKLLEERSDKQRVSLTLPVEVTAKHIKQKNELDVELVVGLDDLVYRVSYPVSYRI
jgi:hypothetical protein